MILIDTRESRPKNKIKRRNKAYVNCLFTKLNTVFLCIYLLLLTYLLTDNFYFSSFYFFEKQICIIFWIFETKSHKTFEIHQIHHQFETKYITTTTFFSTTNLIPSYQNLSDKTTTPHNVQHTMGRKISSNTFGRCRR